MTIITNEVELDLIRKFLREILEPLGWTGINGRVCLIKFFLGEISSHDPIPVIYFYLDRTKQITGTGWSICHQSKRINLDLANPNCEQQIKELAQLIAPKGIEIDD